MSSSAAKVNDLSWMLGGPQGSGVVSSANVVARACAAGGLHIFGKREFYSNIMGEHSYFALRAHSNLVRSHIDSVNVLATFEAETLFRHAREVTDDGAIVYDPSLGKTRLSDVPTIEKRLYADLKTYLISRGVGETLDDLLAASKQRGVTLLPIPFKDLLEQIADEFKVDQLSKISRVVNMLAVGASFGVLGFDFSKMESVLADVFGNKAKIVSMNASGARKAYELAGSLAPDFGYRLERIARKEPRLFLTGSQATALGKLYGGMRFQTYYPITPASDESEFLAENEILDLNGHGLGRLRGVHPRRLPRLQLRGAVPDARDPPRRQGAREQLRDGRCARPLRPEGRPRRDRPPERRIFEGQSVQAVRPRERARVPAG